MIKDLWNALICWRFGHKTTLVFDEIKLRDVDQFGISFDVLEQHKRCERCGSDPL
jgi:hypothetical protein